MTFDIKSFRAFRIHRQDRQVSARFDDIALSDLTAGDVVVRVTYSDINYKDALAATGTAPILRKYPLAGGIDLAGDVVDSSPRLRFTVCSSPCAISREGRNSAATP